MYYLNFKALVESHSPVVTSTEATVRDVICFLEQDHKVPKTKHVIYLIGSIFFILQGSALKNIYFLLASLVVYFYHVF